MNLCIFLNCSNHQYQLLHPLIFSGRKMCPQNFALSQKDTPPRPSIHKLKKHDIHGVSRLRVAQNILLSLLPKSDNRTGREFQLHRTAQPKIGALGYSPLTASSGLWLDLPPAPTKRFSEGSYTCCCMETNKHHDGQFGHVKIWGTSPDS